jgi:alanine racemase
MPVARALVAAGADGLCVATLDEAEALRAAGIGCPILVLYPIPPALAPAAAHLGVSVTAGDADLLARTLEVVRAVADGPVVPPPLAIQVEIETGLGRGGFPADRVGAAIATIAATPGATTTGLWSHLTAAEDALRTTEQERRFLAVVELLGGAGVAVTRHLAASGAVVAGVVSHYDAVRPGLALYGIVPEGSGEGPAPAAGANAAGANAAGANAAGANAAGANAAGSLAAALRPVLSLHARPVRVADLPAGTGISYGPSFTTTRPSRIATLPLGYGDGLARAWSNRIESLVRGVRVPLIGTIAMDAVMADVTDVPGPPVTIDDTFTLIGRQGPVAIDVRDLARSRTTITWEVVTAMARRLPRVYASGGRVVGLRTLTVERDG